jgi:acetyl-CoA acetyltransferase
VCTVSASSNRAKATANQDERRWDETTKDEIPNANEIRIPLQKREAANTLGGLASERPERKKERKKESDGHHVQSHPHGLFTRRHDDGQIQNRMLYNMEGAIGE